METNAKSHSGPKQITAFSLSHIHTHTHTHTHTLVSLLVRTLHRPALILH